MMFNTKEYHSIRAFPKKSTKMVPAVELPALLKSAARITVSNDTVIMYAFAWTASRCCMHVPRKKAASASPLISFGHGRHGLTIEVHLETVPRLLGYLFVLLIFILVQTISRNTSREHDTPPTKPEVTPSSNAQPLKSGIRHFPCTRSKHRSRSYLPRRQS